MSVSLGLLTLCLIKVTSLIHCSAHRLLFYKYCVRQFFVNFFAGATCFTCRSTDSWKQCNINRVKKICPYGTEHCATFSGQESSNASSSIKKIFIKDCAAQTDCYNSDRHCNKHTVLAGTCSYECCHGGLCNKGRSSKESVNVRLVLIITVFAAIKFYSKITWACSLCTCMVMMNTNSVLITVLDFTA